MEREYSVIVNAGVDLKELEAELTASTGSGPIPNRSVDIANPRPGSRRQTHFALTDEEAKELSKDSRIMAVEIPPEQRDDIQIGLHATQTGQFTRTDTLNQNYVNYLLLVYIYNPKLCIPFLTKIVLPSKIKIHEVLLHYDLVR